jgi:hypothetical protein
LGPEQKEPERTEIKRKERTKQIIIPIGKQFKITRISSKQITGSLYSELSETKKLFCIFAIIFACITI